MAALVDLVERFLEQDEWYPERHPEEDVLRASFNGDNGRWQCLVRVRQNVQVMFFSMCPVTVPTERRPAMAEFLTRANYGLVLGNFEMDFEDGEIRYKTSIDVERIPLDLLEQSAWSLDLFKDITYPNVLMMDKYLPGIMRVIASNEAPAAIIAEIEG
ncbi:MAG: YbjN domain-containing protein [Chloroflexaceae bacterium]|nr:YbjN domain-containing protein [Chloroflexaceae bacterium]